MTVQHQKLEISSELYDLVKNEILPGTGLDIGHFWDELEQIVSDFTSENLKLLHQREQFQQMIDAWFRKRKIESTTIRPEEYIDFLKDIDYIVNEGDSFEVATKNVDPEISTINGPQLVVPVNNARFSTNAANARWGSLFDAFYGSPGFNNIIDDKGDASFSKEYNPKRGEHVIEKAHDFLNQFFRLEEGKYGDVASFNVKNNKGRAQLEIELFNGHNTCLQDKNQWLGYQKTDGKLILLFEHHQLKCELVIDRNHPIGREHRAGISDVLLESAITTIQDFEDSVAAVNASDKVLVYRNWNGLMKGTLTAEVDNAPEKIRKLKKDHTFLSPEGNTFSISGRSLLLVRHVGLHMMTNAVTIEGKEIPEGILDCMISCLSAKHDLTGGSNEKGNSQCGSIYVVKPKCHGPDEVDFTLRLFARVEKALGLNDKTIKLGLMDEEQRTSLNLKECVRVAKDRLFFINTGFLDRTGDLLHTQMEAGPFAPKFEMKSSVWMNAYEKNNVSVGLETGLHHCGQIGKGMWAENKNSKGLLETKSNHLKAGASTAWVPSPTMATLHAIHYHELNVALQQNRLLNEQNAPKEHIITLPLMDAPQKHDISHSVEDYAQSILGYVVRWVDAGIGCSSVPDLNGVFLMEDRATLRIGSQLLANWLLHGVITEKQIHQALEKMAQKVDQQNKTIAGYHNLYPDCNGIAFKTARDLILEGRLSVCGYVEESLHKGRKQVLQSS